MQFVAFGKLVLASLFTYPTRSILHTMLWVDVHVAEYALGDSALDV